MSPNQQRPRGLPAIHAWATLCMLACLWVATPAVADQRAKIEAIDGTVISSELAGRIDKIGYREGDSFKKNATLVSIDCTLYGAERDRVAAKFAGDRRRMDNNRRLAELNSVGKLDVELSELAVKESGAELRAAQANAKRCDIAAPFEGRVVELFASVGQSVQAQEKVLQIVGRDLEARVIVPAKWLSWIKQGTPVQLAVEETGVEVGATVMRVGAAVDPVSHTIPLWAKLKDSASLRPGMTAAAHFPDAPREDQASEPEDAQQDS